MRNIQRLLIIAIATSLMLAAFAIPALAGPEGTTLSRINSSRASSGLAPVQVYWDLTDDARAHTNRMIAKGSIYHNPSLSGVTSVWQKLGENVGVGVDANSLHDAFMASSSHRANILGDFNYVGIGAKESEDGIMWVTVIFMKAEPGLNGGGETTTTTAPPTTTTAPPTTTTVPAPVPEPAPTTTTTTTPPRSEADPAQSTGAGVPAFFSSTSSDDQAVSFTAFGRPYGIRAMVR